MPADLIISHARPAAGARRAGASPVTTEGPALFVAALGLVFGSVGCSRVLAGYMYVVALAEKGCCQIDEARRVDEGWEEGKRPLSILGRQARTARFALIDLEPG